MAILEVHHGRGRVEQVALSRDQPVLFGTSPQCDVVLEGPGIAPFHGRIRWKERSKKFKADAAPEVGELLVDGRKVRSASLWRGGEIRVGPCRIVLQGDDVPDGDGRRGATRDGGKTVVRPMPAFRAGEAADDRTVVRPAPRARASKKVGKLEAAEWLDLLEVAPPSGEVEVLDEPEAEALPSSSSKRTRSRDRGGKAPDGARPRGWRAFLRGDWLAEDRPPGQENLTRSPLVLGLIGALVALVLMGAALWRVIQVTNARRDFDRALESYEAGDDRNALQRFDRFLERFPDHDRANRARVLRALANVRQFASGAGPSWSNAVTAAREMVGEVGELAEYRDVGVDLAELVLKAAEGLADRARSAADAEALGEAEGAVGLHAQIAGEPAQALLKRSKVPAKLAEARAAVLKARVRAEALAAMDAALQAGSADDTYAARDRLVARYPDLAGDRELVRRLTSANELIRKAARFDPSGRPGESEPHPDRLGPPTTWVLRSETKPATASGPVVYALADGLAFGVDGETGAPLWQAPVGLSSPFPPAAVPGRTPSALAFDARHDELVRLDGRTGKLLWRQSTDGPVVDPPLILGNQAIQPTPAGRLLLIDLETGALQGAIDLGRPLARTPAADEAGQFLYAMGREANLFIVRRDPPECVAVDYLGHAPGSIPCAPARLGRFLVVPENHAPLDGRWRVLLLEEDGSDARAVQDVPVEGWTWSTPATSGSVIWSTGDRGGASAYAIGPYESKAPFKAIARLVPDARPSGPTFATARGEREVWVASGRSARLDLDLEQAEIRAGWTLGEAGPALAPIQPAGRLAVLTQQWTDGGAALWAVDPESGRARWRTVLGSPWAAAPVELAEGHGLAALGPKGQAIALGADRLAAGGSVEAVIPSSGAFRLPAGPLRRLEAGGATVVVPEGSDQLLVVAGDGGGDGASEPARVPLPAPLAAPAVAWGPDLMVPGGYGRAYLVDPTSGASRAEPFVPPYDRSKPTRWLAPAPLDGDAMALTDASGVIRRFERPTAERPRLVPALQVELDAAIVSDPASTGAALVLATADGRVRSLAARDLSPVGAWPLDAPLAGGPWAVSGLAFAADAAGGFSAFGADGRRLWTAPGRGVPAAGPPVVLDGDVLWLDRDGVLRRHALADGRALEQVPLGIVPAGGPLRLDDRVAVPTGPGSIRMLDEDALGAGGGAP